MIQTTTVFDDTDIKLDYTRPDTTDFLQVMYSLHKYSLAKSPQSSLKVYVSNPDAWRDVKDQIKNLYMFLTSKNLSIDIQKAEPSRTVIRLSEFFTVSLSKVALFSGGADSGVYAALASRNRKSEILSHTETSRTLLGKARTFHKRYASGSCKLARSYAKLFQKENTTNTRALVILGNALAIAGELGVPTVVVPENGPMMINKEVSRLVSATKTGNPWLIQEWAKIFNSVSEKKVMVETPFSSLTKAEVLSLLNDPQAIALTYSCFTSQAQSKMCGLCHACIVRSLSCRAASIKEDLDARYQYNWFVQDENRLGFSNHEKLVVALHALEFWAMLIQPDILNIFEEKARAESIIKLSPILRRHSLDMYLGIRSIFEKESWNAGPVGKRAIELLRSIDSNLLNERKEELDHFKEEKHEFWKG